MDNTIYIMSNLQSYNNFVEKCAKIFFFCHFASRRRNLGQRARDLLEDVFGLLLFAQMHVYKIAVSAQFQVWNKANLETKRENLWESIG